MSLSTGVSGAWKPVIGLSVGVSGAWKSVVRGWVGVSGVWKVFYDALTIALPATIGEVSIVPDPETAVASLTIASNGTYTVSDGDPTGNWATPGASGIGSGYEVRWTVVSGSLSGGTSGTWQSLSSSRTYARNRVGVGSAQAVGTVEIRDASTLTVLTTSTVTLEAEVL